MALHRTDRALAPASSDRGARLVVALLVARSAARGALGWGVVAGVVVYSSVAGFASAYPTAAGREQLAASLGSNGGISALLGPARSIDTVAGFTAWRSLGVLAPVVAIWGLMTATRLLRGAEEAGRWELLLAGQTTRRRAALGAMGGLAAGLVVLLATAAVLITAAGRSGDARFSVPSSLFLALATAAPAAIFLAVGAVTSQLSRTRRQAAALAAGVFGAAYVVRLVADSGTSLQWARWISPLGWVEELHPLTGASPLPFLPIAGLCAALVAAAAWLAGGRDVGASALPDHDVASPHTALLGGPLGLAIRLARPTAAGWACAVAASGLALGLVARSAADAAAGSTLIQDALARRGGGGNGASAYLGFSFLMVGALVALAAAGQVATTRAEEADGLLDNLLVQPLGRARWLAGRLLVGAVLLVVLGAVAGLAAWAGAATQQSGVSLRSLLEAGVNTVPAAFLVLGLGTLAHGLVPRVAAVAAYGVVAWSFLVELVGSVIAASPWVLDLSIFHHVAPAPAANVDWGSAIALTLLGALGAGLGTLALSRRDLAGA